jgi:hypothetical protein
MRALCYHYGVELHNFTPNAISQAATFVGVCEGFLGILVNWDLWVHLFRAALHTLATSEPRSASWYHGVSPPSHQVRLDSLVATLKNLADRGLTAGCVLANLHHRRIVPLMERRLRIFEMNEGADPVALAESRLLRDLFPREYAATRARCAIDLKPGRCDNASLWAFAMLPVGQLVSEFLDFLSGSADFWVAGVF